MEQPDPGAALLISWIALVLGEADRLRAKGVLSIGAAGCSATFAPAPPPAPTSDAAPGPAELAPDTDGLDALHDPHSYPGGVVPGYQIKKFDRFDPIEE